jgi:hypothetical protein
MPPPEPVSPPTFRPTYTPEFISDEDVVAYAHALIGEQRDREYGGYIFKRGERFIATTPLSGSTFSFTPAEVYPRTAAGHPTRPRHLDLVGIYHSHPDVLTDPLEINSFSTGDIYAAIKLYEQTPGAACYLSNPDGSLLKFTPADSDLTQALLLRVTPKEPNGKISPLSEGLAAGTASRLSFVQQVAGAGRLQVIRASQLWRFVGDVSPKWQPLHQGNDLINAERLGPSFLKPEEALNWLLQHLPHSTPHTLSAGLLLTHTHEKHVVPTYPLAINDAGFAIESLLPGNDAGVVELPTDYTISGVYFAPLRNRSDSSVLALNGKGLFVSPELIFALLSKLLQHPDLSAYFYTQEATLFQYTSLGTPEEKHLLDVLIPFGGSRCQVHRTLANGTLSPEAFIRQVAAAGELRVLHPHGSWTRHGRIPADWAPATPTLINDRSLTPVMRQRFIDADDAVHAMTQELEAYDLAIIGIVLENRLHDTYVTSIGLSGSTLDYHYIGPFSPQASRRPALPQGYVPRGIYFRPRHSDLTPTPEPYPNAGTFFHPQAFEFFFQLRAYGLDISEAYWASTEGALIKYTSRNSIEEFVFGGMMVPATPDSASQIQNDLNAGDLSLEIFISTWAQAGELTVLRTDSYWPQRGVYAPTAPGWFETQD